MAAHGYELTITAITAVKKFKNTIIHGPTGDRLLPFKLSRHDQGRGTFYSFHEISEFERKHNTSFMDLKDIRDFTHWGI